MRSISRAEILPTNDKSHLGHIAQSLCISHDHFVTFLQLFAVRSRSKLRYGPPQGWSGQETEAEMVAACSDQCTDWHIYGTGLKGSSYGGGGDMGRELNGAGGRESSRASDGNHRNESFVNLPGGGGGHTILCRHHFHLLFPLNACIHILYTP